MSHLFRSLELSHKAFDIAVMDIFTGNPFLWAFAILVLIAGIYGLRAFLGYRAVARDAEADYEYKRDQNMIDPRLSREGYIRAYRRYNNPRSTAYVAGAMTAILVLTAPSLAIMQFAYEKLWMFSGQSRVFEPGFLVWQFFLFFSIIAIWAAIGYVVARRYHRRSPTSWRDEQVKEFD